MKLRLTFLDIICSLFLVLCLINYSDPSRNGAPGFFCFDKTVQDRNYSLRYGHNAPPMNELMVPTGYRIEFGPEMTNGTRRVTLRAAPGDYFKGFFIQATKSNYSLDRQDRPAYGTFRPVDANSQPRKCRAAVGIVGGITHTGNMNKTEVSVDWLPPVGCNLGDVQFVATVVRGYSEYWVDIRSDIIQPSGFVRRSLLCELYVDPYNRQLQGRVLQALRALRQRRRRLQAGRIRG